MCTHMGVCDGPVSHLYGAGAGPMTAQDKAKYGSCDLYCASPDSTMGKGASCIKKCQCVQPMSLLDGQAKRDMDKKGTCDNAA